ncbi:MAG: T9SS type A sorting domain-containing protein [Ignavibacteria bacterium]|nr:T9SS type A sorting domain-containing protein [Ignavibacteria bacterium]
MRICLLILAFFVLNQLTFSQPLQHHILLATSKDGLTFERKNRIIVNSGDVPDAVVGTNGKIYLYFQGLWTPTIDGIMVGISSDGLYNWEFHKVNIFGTESWFGRPCDPDVVFFKDTFRLYFTGDPINDKNPETYSAISTDGINFVLEKGIRFQVPGNSVLDPSVLWTGKTLQFFAGGAPQGKNWHAHSNDGINFVKLEDFSIDGLMMANGIEVPNGYRFYCFKNLQQKDIFSIFSTNGDNWELESGNRLAYDGTCELESKYVKDPAIVRKDNLYIMYYVTRKPNVNSIENSNENNNKINIYPNPATYSSFLTLANDGPQKVLIDIFDTYGKYIDTIHNGYLPVGNISFEINTQNFANGFYLIKVKSATKSFECWLVVLR